MTILSKLLLWGSLVGLSTAATSNVLVPKIVGGSNANVTHWPWVVALVTKDSNNVFCGASLVAKNWVLTAAHCVQRKAGEDIEVLLNKPNLSSFLGERISVERIKFHPQFDPSKLHNDLALLKLSGFSTLPPIETLPEFSDQDLNGHDAVALGWGSLAPNGDGPFPEVVQQVTLPIVSNANCSEYIRGVIETMLCAGFKTGGKDTCYGDSGGPLVVFDNTKRTWRQVGVTSFSGATECAAKNAYGVYTRLKAFKRFIADTICSATSAPPTPTLKFKTKGNVVTLEWTTHPSVTGYRLVYAPYPAGEPIASIEAIQRNSFTATLPKGSAFYVSVSAYNGNCISNLSNITHVVIN